jgi:dolichyl-phosphate beta-glucosyltransferase
VRPEDEGVEALEGSVHLSVVVPAYNEERRIGPTLERILGYLGARRWTAEVLVVIDGSRDRTAAVVRGIATRAIPVQVLDARVNRGKGACVRRGMLAARGALRLFTDADLSTPIEELERLATVVGEGHDVAIGSRRLPASRITVAQPWWRRAMGRTFAHCVQRVALPGIRDTQCGFKLFSGAAAAHIFPRQRIDDFGFDVEVLWIARRLGLRIAEVPVTWTDDPRSTVRPIVDSLRMLSDLARIRRADRRGLYVEGGAPRPQHHESGGRSSPAA